MKDYVEERVFKTAEELLNALAPWSSTIKMDDFIFRGHSDQDYLLLPTSIRKDSIESIWNYSRAYVEIVGSSNDNDFSLAFVEYQLIRDFYREADLRGLEVPTSERLRRRLHQKIDFQTMSGWVDGEKWLPNDMLDVAALAQHYGVHTRLLDWTYDPFVAAYFASKPTGRAPRDLCIWGLNAKTIGTLDSAIDDFPLRLVTPHYSGNPNLAAQSGLFTHWAHSVPSPKELSNRAMTALPPVDRTPLDALLREYLSTLSNDVPVGLFVKWILPANEVLKLARLLREFGYGPGKLFPGYEGVAMELKERIFFPRKRLDN
ncbi:FRG domain-containing protein [Pseudomonas pergaminensis]|uniref:FRG domain-containing protein n=1 Tax=Pseudomonas pergaminensis TaxID=2853159 RepID=UPI0034D597B6